SAAMANFHAAASAVKNATPGGSCPGPFAFSRCATRIASPYTCLIEDRPNLAYNAGGHVFGSVCKVRGGIRDLLVSAGGYIIHLARSTGGGILDCVQNRSSRILHRMHDWSRRFLHRVHDRGRGFLDRVHGASHSAPSFLQGLFEVVFKELAGGVREPG